MDLREMLADFILNKTKDEFETALEEFHSIDIALQLEEFEDDEILDFCEYISNKLLALIIEEAPEELQIRIIRLLSTSDILDVFSFLPKDEIVDILGGLPTRQKKDLLSTMKISESKQLETLLNYEVDSAGGIMTTEYIALKESMTVETALQTIKNIAPRTEVIETLFVLGRSNELVGSVDLRDILVSDGSGQLSDIVNRNIISVFPETDQEEVSILVSKYNLDVIPVINRRNALLGIITLDDIIDVITEESTEDILKLGGVDKDETMNSTLKFSIQKRLPWLLVNLFTAFLASLTVAMFEGTISKIVILAAAMPIVTGMGGNSGTQTLTIVIRGIALGEVNLKDDWQLVFKEIWLGIFNGLVVGTICALVFYIFYGNIYLGFIMIAAMIGNLVVAGFFGFIIPLALKKMKLDPALSGAIFLTTATDVLGFFMFLGLATIFQNLLI